MRPARWRADVDACWLERNAPGEIEDSHGDPEHIAAGSGGVCLIETKYSAYLDRVPVIEASRHLRS